MGLSAMRLPSGLYEASATPLHVEIAGSSLKPLPARELVRELEDRCCHKQDIDDVMYEQDPSWLEEL